MLLKRLFQRLNRILYSTEVFNHIFIHTGAHLQVSIMFTGIRRWVSWLLFRNLIDWNRLGLKTSLLRLIKLQFSANSSCRLELTHRFLSLLRLELRKFKMLWWVVILLGTTVYFTISRLLHNVIISARISLQIINLTLHHLLISQILYIRIINIIISYLYFTNNFIYSVLRIPRFQMYIRIAHHAQRLWHRITFKNVLAGYVALNRLIIVNF